ncbi:thiamine biosynthesis protein ThiS [Streptococcus chosunense]|uniref:Thiamine biosynthesis protein ThiS n=2 Tax=Streptococcus mitis group TaxID=3409772 RepID=A0A3B0BLR3_9STRE|nr:ThiS protein [Streptococcus mitis 18/56]RKN74040.1 thiamine biosynthesis protein ThiS [Streptococcus chosunense]
MFLYKIVAFLPNVCYNNKVNKTKKGVEVATPTPPIKTKQPFA